MNTGFRIGDVSLRDINAEFLIGKIIYQTSVRYNALFLFQENEKYLFFWNKEV